MFATVLFSSALLLIAFFVFFPPPLPCFATVAIIFVAHNFAAFLFAVTFAAFLFVTALAFVPVAAFAVMFAAAFASMFVAAFTLIFADALIFISAAVLAFISVTALAFDNLIMDVDITRPVVYGFSVTNFNSLKLPKGTQRHIEVMTSRTFANVDDASENAPGRSDFAGFVGYDLSGELHAHVANVDSFFLQPAIIFSANSSNDVFVFFHYPGAVSATPAFLVRREIHGGSSFVDAFGVNMYACRGRERARREDEG